VAFGAVPFDQRRVRAALIHAAVAFALLFAEAALNVTIVAAVSYSSIVRPTPRSRARRRTSAAAAASSAATPTDL